MYKDTKETLIQIHIKSVVLQRITKVGQHLWITIAFQVSLQCLLMENYINKLGCKVILKAVHVPSMYRLRSVCKRMPFGLYNYAA